MPSPGICWSSVLCCHWEYTWNKVGLWSLLWLWASSLSTMCLALEREKTDACLFFLLFVRKILWMASKVLGFLHVVLPFNSMAAAHLDERCSLHKQFKLHVHRIFQALWLPCCLCQCARVHGVLQAFLGWEYVRAVNYSSVPGWLFYKQVWSVGTFPSFKTHHLHLDFSVSCCHCTTRMNPERVVW